MSSKLILGSVSEEVTDEEIDEINFEILEESEYFEDAEADYTPEEEE